MAALGAKTQLMATILTNDYIKATMDECSTETTPTGIPFGA